MFACELLWSRRNKQSKEKRRCGYDNRKRESRPHGGTEGERDQALDPVCGTYPGEPGEGGHLHRGDGGGIHAAPAEGDDMKQEEVRRDKAKRLRYKKAAVSGLTTWEMQET